MQGKGKILFAAAAAIVLALANIAEADEKGAANSASLPGQPLTMHAAVVYGLEHNPLIFAAEEQIQAAAQSVNQAEAKFYPKLDTGYSFTELDDQPYQTFNGQDIPSSHTELNRWEVTLTQPLFTGFSLSGNLAAAKIGKDIASYDRDGVRMDCIRDVQHAFLQVLLSNRLLEVARDHIKALEVQRKNAVSQFGQGLTPRNDVLKADVALAEATQNERAAVKDLHLAKSRLNRLLNIDYSVDLTLEESDWENAPPPNTLTLEQLFLQAQEQRPELRSAKAAIDAARQRMRVAKSGYFPQISAVGGYYREGEDFLADKNDYTNNYNASVGLKLRWNLFEGGETHAAAKEWVYRRNALERQEEDLVNRVYLQIQDAYEQVGVAKANIETSRTALAQALENERITTVQYREQMVVFSEVLDAQVYVMQSRADYYKALYGHRMAWADLQRAIGASF
ncbi:MAG: TolC family protein [Syntrophobacteraceae bacterium]